jgi:hypothetical protein
MARYRRIGTLAVLGSIRMHRYSRSLWLAVYGGALKGNGSISCYGSLQVNGFARCARSSTAGWLILPLAVLSDNMIRSGQWVLSLRVTRLLILVLLSRWLADMFWHSLLGWLTGTDWYSTKDHGSLQRDGALDSCGSLQRDGTLKRYDSFPHHGTLLNCRLDRTDWYSH